MEIDKTSNRFYSSYKLSAPRAKKFLNLFNNGKCFYKSVSKIKLRQYFLNPLKSTSFNYFIIFVFSSLNT